VLIINGDKEVAAADVDFEKRQIWKILVGGAKLSRGFTIEGLTVSYYRRKTQQADTLMQMGRWFGFRKGYRDLVRLYIRRGEQAGGPATFDLYAAFEAACRSEELFRAELERYAKLEDGRPVITPAQVPPLVAQHLGWLKPAASNKMYNARLVERRSPGENLEPVGFPEKSADIERNTRVLLPLVDLATDEGRFAYSTKTGTRTFPARHGRIKHEELVVLLKQLRWLPSDHFEADLNWLQDLKPDQIEDWAILLPQHAGSGSRTSIEGREPLSAFRRQRRRGPLFGAISDPKHRQAAARIAGVGPDLGDPATERLRHKRRGTLSLYPVVEMPADGTVPDELTAAKVILAPVFVAPTSTGSPDGTLVRFVVRDKSREDEPIVDLDEAS
jgi:hypothetical protein